MAFRCLPVLLAGSYLQLLPVVVEMLGSLPVFAIIECHSRAIDVSHVSAGSDTSFCC